MGVLKVVVADLQPLGLSAPVAPRLPTLEKLLAQADVMAIEPNWRAFAAPSWAVNVVAPLPLAATLAAAAGLEAPGTWYLASALHLVAGLNHVRVHPAGPLTLSLAQQTALVESFERDWGEADMTLLPTPSGLLCKMAVGPVPETFDPDPFTGQDIAGALPRGEGALALQRVMTELQMWLYQAPLTGTDDVAVNALWLWGGSHHPVTRPNALPACESDDAYLNALSTLATNQARVSGDEVITVRVSALGREGNAFELAEERYFQPLQRRILSGRFSQVQLWFGGRVYRLQAWQRLRYWRRPQPWWQGEAL